MAVDVSRIPNNNKFDPVREAILDLQSQLEAEGQTAYDGTLTIGTSGNLTGSGTFTANQSGDTTITIGIDDSSYLTEEVNDLTAAVTWANVPDANITQSSVTQHQAALSITESQINDLQDYLVLTETGSQTIDGSVVISGSFTVNGTTTYLNTETVRVEDNIIELNRTPDTPNDTATAATSGIEIYRGNAVTPASFIFDDADDTWDLTNNLAVAGTITTGGNNVITLGDLSASTNATPFGSGALLYNEATGDFEYTPPDLSGFVSSSALNAYLPLAGGTLTGLLTTTDVDIFGNATSTGYYTSSANTSGQTYGNFTASGTEDWYMFSLGARGASAGAYGIGLKNTITDRTLSIHVPNHAAYSSTGAIPKIGFYSNGAVELFTVQSDSGDTYIKGDLNVGNVTGDSFIKDGGTSSEFLKADGSVDSNTYLTSYTETDTLDSVTDRNATTTNVITTGGAIINGVITMPQNPVGTTYGNGISTTPSYMIQQGAGDNDGIRLYAEAGVTNDVRYIFEVIDDLETGDTWVFRNKKTYGDFAANEVVKISGSGDITANSYIKSGGTQTQFLKADGTTTELSVNTGSGLGGGQLLYNAATGVFDFNPADLSGLATTTQLNGYLPLTGGTLTGGLTGTTANFFGSIDGTDHIWTTNGNSTYTSPHDTNVPLLAAYNNSNSSVNAHAIMSLRTGGPNGGDPFVSFDIEGVTGWSFGMDNSDGDKLKFANAWSSLSTNTRVTIQTTGEVGIGTNSPSDKLDVRGGIVSYGTNNYFLTGASTNDHIQLQWNDAGGYGKLLTRQGGTYYDNTLVLKSGKVGIKETNPQFDFHVGGPSARLRVGPYYTTGGDRDFVDLLADGQDSKVISNNERFHIENNNGHVLLMPSSNVGIGTTLPEQKLHVEGTIQLGNTEDLAWAYDNGNYYNYITNNYNTTDGMIFRSGSWTSGNNIDFSFETWYSNAWNKRLVIKADGNVGIGTNTPIMQLHVNNAGGTGMFVSNTTNDIGGYMFAGTAGLEIQGVNSSNSGIRNIIMQSYGANVGIGSTTPTEKLTVVGNICFGSSYNGGIYVDSNASGNSDSNWGLQVQRTSGVDDYNTRLKFYPAAGTSRKLGLYDGRNNSWILYADGNANSNCRVVVTNNLDVSANQTVSGYLFVGTTTAGAARLFVQGGDQYCIRGSHSVANSTQEYYDALFLANTNQNNSNYCSVGLSTYGSDGQHHRAQIRAYKGSGNYEGALHFYIRQRDTGAWRNAFVMDYLGKFHADNDIIAFSTTASDAKFKDDVVTIDSAIEKIKGLRGVEFTWNATGRKGQRDLGFIAQEVEEVLPEIVRENELCTGEFAKNPTTAKTVDYDKVVAVLVEAVKEQQKQIDELKSRLDGSTY